MWRGLARRVSSSKSKLFSDPLPLSCPRSPLLLPGARNQLNSRCPHLGFLQIGGFPIQNSNLGQPAFEFSRGLLRAYASVAEAIASEEESSSGCDEVQELIEEMNRQVMAEEQQMLNQKQQQQQQPKKMLFGMVAGKYHFLRTRQVRMETEAWETAAKEYQELLVDMCEQKLAPNLPYMKSLFLGWFEPLRDAIAADQEMCKQKRVKPSYAPFWDHLPADMMAVITMHKLMGLLMTTNGGNGSCRVVQAACQIGEAIEHEVMLQNFLEKTKKKGKNIICPNHPKLKQLKINHRWSLKTQRS